MKSSSNALDPTLGFIQCFELLKFLEYPLGVEHERGRIADDIRSMFDAI